MTRLALRPPENVGPEIRRRRLAAGLSMEQFAYRIGVTFSTVSRWENGYSRPHRISWREIERLFPAAQQGDHDERG